MGQFLSTGLVSNVYVSLNEMEKAEISQEKIVETLEKSFGYSLEIFDIKKNDTLLTFDLKKDILKKELLPFLEEFYKDMHHLDIYSVKVLEKLKKTPFEEWLELADSKFYEYFQTDDFGEDDYMDFGEWPDEKIIHFSYKSIMLAIEGKIIMEMYGEQFRFFKYCMGQTYKQFKLASALRVYITG